jgi:hypothetical protein
VPDLTDLLEQLHSNDPDARARGIERAAVAVERLIHAVVASLETAGANDKFLSDHVHRFGPTMIEPVEALLHRSTDPDVRVLCALLLLRLHSRSGLDTLLAELELGGRWALEILEQLARSRIHSAAPRIVHRLREVPLENEAEIHALLAALDRLEHSIPADVIPRLQSPEAPESLRSAANAIIDGAQA